MEDGGFPGLLPCPDPPKWTHSSLCVGTRVVPLWLVPSLSHFLFPFVFVGWDLWGNPVQYCPFLLSMPGTGGSHGYWAISFLGTPNTRMVSALMMGYCDFLAKLHIPIGVVASFANPLASITDSVGGT